MKHRLPFVPTLCVGLAVAAMIALGIWQLRRAEWKAALLDHYAAAENLPPVAFPTDPDAVEDVLYRRSMVECAQVLSQDAMAGRNAKGRSGWVQSVHCRLAAGGEADLVLGWQRRPETGTWAGGPVRGVIGPGRGGTARLIADPPLAGLEANARPDPADLPNNHMSYAVQWFFFALTALVIYALALRRKWRDHNGRVA
ncbi:SURF1 family protein [Altericroceibacterium spongiae]|uniref:SURF1-like protein n=1 Tax=Altericroceibacterium spongiae TaxID=2320269 RepID=A0A420EJY5_9SPHN|nr:SURF1 family protein [Altericroceibacterium spongiae]RKF20987.1 SURF1 family protein [Altericroceibacterium spongiae]